MICKENCNTPNKHKTWRESWGESQPLCCFFPENRKTKYTKGLLAPPGLSAGFLACSWAPFGLCSVKSRHMFILLFFPPRLFAFLHISPGWAAFFPFLTCVSVLTYPACLCILYPQTSNPSTAQQPITWIWAVHVPAATCCLWLPPMLDRFDLPILFLFTSLSEFFVSSSHACWPGRLFYCVVLYRTLLVLLN